ncbi:MAG: MOSC domain-containing protein [Nocardioides sp.]
MGHLSTAELERHLDHLRAAPKVEGTLGLVVRRPAVRAREVVPEGVLDAEVGLVGDNWLIRGSRSTSDGSANPEAQVTVMSHRMVGVLSDDPEVQALTGDQLYVDLDLSVTNLPVGARITVGDALLQISAKQHTGCAKFVERFGPEVMRFVNGRVGRELRLRGLNTSVVSGGAVRVGDAVRRL